jgi:hypothetical protein
MAKKQTAIEKARADELAEFDAILGGMESDGLEEVDQSDVKIPIKSFNRKGKQDNGIMCKQDRFYDTNTNDEQEALNATLLLLHKTHIWKSFDETTKTSTVHCKSYDRKTGTMNDGTTRKCAGCPDAQWRTIDGKRIKRCSVVHNVVGIDHDNDDSPFIVRFKKTSEGPWQKHLNRCHIGKLRTSAGKRNLPLFGQRVRIELVMEDGGNYALPVFAKMGDVPPSEWKRLAGDVAFLRDAILPALQKAPEQGESDDERADGAIDAAAFVDAEPSATSTSTVAEPAGAW